MIRRNRIYIGIVTILLLMLGGALSPVLAYQPVQQPSAWRTKPVMSNERYPEYRFQSTSTCAPIVGQTSYTTAETYNPFQASAPHRVRAEYNPWEDEPDDDDENYHPVGELDDPAPIGSPFILLIMALIYIAFIQIRTKVMRKK